MIRLKNLDQGDRIIENIMNWNDDFCFSLRVFFQFLINTHRHKWTDDYEKKKKTHAYTYNGYRLEEEEEEIETRRSRDVQEKRERLKHEQSRVFFLLSHPHTNIL